MTSDPWAEHAADWDTNPATVAYAEGAMDSLRDALPITPTQRVLDFGCGTGLLAERLAPHVADIVAVDASPAMVTRLRAKELPNVRPVAATWTPESVAAAAADLGTFDLVVCSSVCGFLPDYPGAVAMLASLLRPGGHFVQWDWELDPTADEPYGLTRDAIRDAIAGAGITVVSVDVGFEVPFEGHTMAPLMGIGRAP